MAFKLVLSDGKSGLSVQKELDDKATKSFIGLKIGDGVKGELIDLQGFEFQLTGGSDYCGFPMRKDVQGTGRKKILAYQGVGFKKDRKGILQRKTVCGNTIHVKTAQVNLKVIKHGTAGIFDEVKKKLEEKKKNGEKKAEKSPEKEGKESKEPREIKPDKAPVEPAAGKDKKQSEKGTKESKPQKDAPVKAEAGKDKTAPAKEKSPESKPAAEKPAGQKK